MLPMQGGDIILTFYLELEVSIRSEAFEPSPSLKNMAHWLHLKDAMYLSFTSENISRE
jgi:hypothetical protein